MNIGARGHDLNVSNVSDIITVCKQNNINGVQLVVNKTWEDLYNQRNLTEISSRIKQLQEAGIKIFLLGTYFNPVHPNEKSVAEGVDKVKFNIEIAKECGLQYLGSETGSLNGDAWTYNEGNHTKESFDKVMTIFSSFKNDWVEENKKFLVEPVYDHVVYDGNVLENLINELNCENYEVTFDLANVLNTNNYMDYEKIADEFFKKHHEKIRLMHFKNFVIQDNAKVGVRLDKGLIDYKKIIALVDKYKLLEVPCIVEELENDDLFESVKYIHKLRGDI